MVDTIAPVLPGSGDKPWDATLNSALAAMIAQGNALTAIVNGGGAGGSGAGGSVLPWAPYTSYAVGVVAIAPDNSIIRNTSAHTSGGTYSGASWTQLTFTPTKIAATYVPFGSSPPDPTIAPVYVDTTTAPPVLKGWSGTAWAALGGSYTTTPTTPDASLLTESGNSLTTEAGDYLLTA